MEKNEQVKIKVKTVEEMRNELRMACDYTHCDHCPLLGHYHCAALFDGRTDDDTVVKAYHERFSSPVDQHAKADAGKAPISLVPMEIVWAIAWIRKYGNEKYGDPDNWKNVEPERYRDALMRHILHYISAPKSIDEESRYPHLWHAACNMAFLINMEYGDMCHYDFAVEKPEWEKIGKEAVENIIGSPSDDGEIRCKNCLYFDEDEDGEHCVQCKRNYCDMFVRKDK